MIKLSTSLFVIGFALFVSVFSSCSKNEVLDEPRAEQLEEVAHKGRYRIEVTKLDKGTSYVPLLQFMGEYDLSACTPALAYIADSIYRHHKEWHPELATYKKWHIGLLYGDYPGLFQSTIVFETTEKAHGAYVHLSTLPVESSFIEGKKEGFVFRGYFNGKLMKEKTIYIDSNLSVFDLSLGNFKYDLPRLEKQEENGNN